MSTDSTNNPSSESTADLQQRQSDYQNQIGDLQTQLQQPDLVSDHKRYAKVSRKYNELSSKLTAITKVIELEQALVESRELEHGNNEELAELAREEALELENSLTSAKEALRELEREVDPLDRGDAIIEVRAGTGGDEAALFTQDLYRMYTRFAERTGLNVELANINYGNAGGYKEVVFFVTGEGAFGNLRYESGVHRVQRIPETESSGRIHTSAASVVVLPQSEDIEVEVRDEDIRVDVYRSSGPGGQSVNTTDSAVRIVHEPTGIVVTCQDEKSQLKNKAKALKILQAKLYDIAEQERQAEMAATRQSAIKGGDRSAKIRTYNYPQSRVTDHRIKQSWHNLSEILDGELTAIVTALRTHAEADSQK